MLQLNGCNLKCSDATFNGDYSRINTLIKWVVYISYCYLLMMNQRFEEDGYSKVKHYRFALFYDAQEEGYDKRIPILNSFLSNGINGLFQGSQ